MSVRAQESRVLPTAAVLWGVPRGIAQVYLQDSVVTGVLFLVALLVAGPAVGLAALLGSALGWGAALVLRTPVDRVTRGYYGFNVALVAVGMLSTGRGWRSCLLAVPGVLLVQAAIEGVGLVPATFPFVLAMWTADLWRARRVGSRT